ncbi:MAG TPA: hypothetical protein DEA63_03490 [Firmicutes bacterium]|nr:hypothetical protein [Bacillota bacterium]
MQLSTIAASAIGSNTVALMLAVVSYLACYRRFHKKTATSACLFLMLLLTGLSAVSDTISSILDGQPGNAVRIILYIVNTCSFITTVMLLTAWLLFLFAFFDGKLKKPHFLLTHIPMLVGIILILANPFLPLFFTITPENTYLRLPGYYVLVVVELAILASSILYHFIDKRHAEPFQFYSMVIFLAPILIGVILQACFYGVSLQWPSVAIGIVGLFLTIQNQSIYRDSLTGLYNRAYLTYLQQRYRLKNVSLAAIMIDLNDFKNINDQFGHQMGDKALIEAARTFVSIVGKKGNVIRYAGDEFLIFIRSPENEIGETFIRQINEAFAKQKQTEERPYFLSVSMGCLEYRLNSSNSLDDLLFRIDEKMYEAKKRFHESHHLSRQYE